MQQKRKDIDKMSLYRMSEILDDARKKQYGVGFFDALNMEMVRAYLDAAEETNSPIIIGITEILLPIVPLDWISECMIEAAKRARVPVAVHLDHAYSFDVLMQALRLGYGSIMYDGSRETHEKNMRNSAQLARIAHGMGAGLECEIGMVGGLENEDGAVDQVVYTDPADAHDFMERTEADFLAVSIGTVHGVYRAKPNLDIPRLHKIRETVDAPLVLHGGSGLSDEDFRRAIDGGISKINIYTDIVLAGQHALAACPHASYGDSILAAVQGMKSATIKKLKLFGCEGRA